MVGRLRLLHIKGGIHKNRVKQMLIILVEIRTIIYFYNVRSSMSVYQRMERYRGMQKQTGWTFVLNTAVSNRTDILRSILTSNEMSATNLTFTAYRTKRFSANDSACAHSHTQAHNKLLYLYGLPQFFSSLILQHVQASKLIASQVIPVNSQYNQSHQFFQFSQL